LKTAKRILLKSVKGFEKVGYFTIFVFTRKTVIYSKMEENNNNGLFKGLAIILVAILGLNVYRTETTKTELSQLSATVDQLTARLDSIGVVEMPSGKAAAPAVTKKQFNDLSRLVSNLESKVSSLAGSVDRLSRSQSQAGTAAKANVTSSAYKAPKTTATAAASAYGRVSVSAKVKVENRYVIGTTYLPKVTTGPAGVVVIDVTMKRVGTVIAVSINPASTITDEDIIDLCKESALKTNFSINFDAPEKEKGTITYSFTSK
jgi:hypothetical protein